MTAVAESPSTSGPAAVIPPVPPGARTITVRIRRYNPELDD